MEAMFAVMLTSALIFGPLGWRLWADRKRARADSIAADIRWAVNHRLKGESLLSVQVTPEGLRRPGRVVLSAPSGYEWLVERAWPVVVERVPAGYDLVVKLEHPGATRSCWEAYRLPRAAPAEGATLRYG